MTAIRARTDSTLTTMISGCVAGDGDSSTTSSASSSGSGLSTLGSWIEGAMCRYSASLAVVVGIATALPHWGHLILRPAHSLLALSFLLQSAQVTATNATSAPVLAEWSATGLGTACRRWRRIN